MRRVKHRVPYEVASQLAFAYLYKHHYRPIKAYEVAAVIWPDKKFVTKQAAGAAAARILNRMARENLSNWSSDSDDGWWGLGSRAAHVERRCDPES